MSELEEDVLELRLAEQGIFRQSLEDKNARIGELELEVQTLRSLLNEYVLAPRPAPRPQTRVPGLIPKRWSVR